MGRGKIEIKAIENKTNRQVTYSKRRGGIIKKANELSVLCDAKVSLIMFSSSGKLHEYCSPSTTTKELYDRYQQLIGTNLWATHYEKMRNDLTQVKRINNSLKKEIRKRTGEDLDGLQLEELRGLEQKLRESAVIVRGRKSQMIKNQTETTRKKVKNLEENNAKLLRILGGIQEDVNYMDDEAGGAHYEDGVGLSNGGHHLFFRAQPCQPNLHTGGYGLQDLRLA